MNKIKTKKIMFLVIVISVVIGFIIYNNFINKRAMLKNLILPKVSNENAKKCVSKLIDNLSKKQCEESLNLISSRGSYRFKVDFPELQNRVEWYAYNSIIDENIKNIGLEIKDRYSIEINYEKQTNIDTINHNWDIERKRFKERYFTSIRFNGPNSFHKTDVNQVYEAKYFSIRKVGYYWELPKILDIVYHYCPVITRINSTAYRGCHYGLIRQRS